MALCVLPAVRADAEDSSLFLGWQDVWIFRLFLNVLGYATIIIPGYFLIGYFKRINYLETGLLKKHLVSSLVFILKVLFISQNLFGMS